MNVCTTIYTKIRLAVAADVCVFSFSATTSKVLWQNYLPRLLLYLIRNKGNETEAFGFVVAASASV